MPGFMVVVDGEWKHPCDHLEEAKTLAHMEMEAGRAAQIEAVFPPAPVVTYRYDEQLADWVPLHQ